MVTGFILLVIAMMKLFPHIPASRLLHRGLVELPLLKLATMDRRHAIFGVVLLVMLFTASEMIMLFGSADVVMLMAWDVSIHVDAVIAAWMLATLNRGKAMWVAFAAMMRRPLRSARRRSRRQRRGVPGKAANDDDDGGVRVYARAA